MPGGNITDDYILIELLGKVFVIGAALLKNCPLLKQNYKMSKIDQRPIVLG